MGAPPGIGSSTSAPTPIAGDKSSSVPPASGPAAPPPPDPLVAAQLLPASLSVDETRLRLAKGLRLFSDQHLDSARQALQPVAQDPLAKAILGGVEDQAVRLRAFQGSLALKALAQDHARLQDFSEFDQEKLREAVSDIETQLLGLPNASWSQAIEAAKPGFSADTLKVWERFAKGEAIRLKEMESLFQEKDRELLGKGLLNLAERYRQQKYFGTSWTLAQLAAEFPETEEKALALSQYLEGRRTSTEYVISDMFDQGGTSMAINLLSLIPAVKGARWLSQTSRLVSRPLALRLPAMLLAGGGIHWASTKGLMWISGYDGQIMPRSFGEFGAEFASSTAQTGLALLLANRFWKIKPAAAKEVAAETEAASAASFRQRLFGTLAKGGRGLWWTTKTGLKISTLTATDLATQWAFHATGIKDMTPRGFPQGLVRHLFPGTYESRQTVISTYEARRLLEQHYNTLGAATESPGPSVLEPGFNLDLFLTELDPSLDGDRREMAYAAFAQASHEKKLGLNIRRWILHKKKAGEYASANKTLERQGLPLRLDQDGFLCFTDSKQFPCP